MYSLYQEFFDKGCIRRHDTQLLHETYSKTGKRQPGNGMDTINWGDGMAQFARASDSRFYDISDKSTNPVRNTRQTCEFFHREYSTLFYSLWFFRVKNVVPIRCRCARSSCVYTHAYKMIKYARYISCGPCQSSVDYGNLKTLSPITS